MNAAPYALEVKRLTVRFGGVVALSDVTLQVPASQFHGLIGPNGAGKSSLFNAISGIVPTASGLIRIHGVDLTRKPAHARAALGVQRTFQSVQLIRAMTVLENILTGLHASTAGAGRFGGTRRADLERAHAMASALGLADCLYQRTDSLSFRQQRFVEIARALVSEPRLVLLDEPAAGLSAPEVDELGDLLLRLQARHGFTVVLVEHVISLVMRLCSHVTVLENGTVLSSGPGSAVMDDPEVIRAYLGEGLDA